MTAWTAVVVAMCLLAKCGVDFIALEYGGEFQFISDDSLIGACAIMCMYALFVDAINFVRCLGGK